MRAQTGTDLGVRLRSDQGAVGGGDDRGEGGVADEVAVDSGSRAAALGDGPHDEALAAAHVTGHEHAGNARLEVSVAGDVGASVELRSEEHTSELQSLMRISYAVFCLKKKIRNIRPTSSRKQHRERRQKNSRPSKLNQ